ncbi:MAG: DnaD domain protein [Lachnospiraceae bacterium]|nr:DnaD domain protein [Lachnospiraceae bacterium]
MGNFVLKTESLTGTTSVSNLFLDRYMPKANGEYVKVYLFLLRALHNPSQDLSVAGLADALDHTESDILRALKYWEKQKLLKLECSSSKELQGIYLLNIPSEDAPTEPLSCSQESLNESVQTTRKNYSRSELARFSTQTECRQLLFVCEQYMKKTLSPSEIEVILYFYDQLHFSVDLIEYLVEYCVCKGSKSIHYIETVALAWAEAGITTVAQAKERTTTYTRNTFAIMKAFGLNDRNPVEPEVKYIEKWLRKYDFTLDLILEACHRTMDKLHKPNFEYADRILKKWQENKVRTMADVQTLDLAHQKRTAQKKPAANARSTGFSNFEQRDYDFDELEKQLLQSQ